MAGSWDHMTTSKGKLRSSESFAQLIENLGDAYEAAEECYGMIWWLADQVAALYYHDEQIAPSREQIHDVIRQAVASYKDGLAIGGVQGE